MWFEPLPGTRREVQAIAGLFSQSTVHLGSEASEQSLESLRAGGRLSEFAVIHLATHGKIDDLMPMNSRLLLSQDRLSDPASFPSSGQPFCDGVLLAGEVMDTWRLNAELVTLSACRSGLGRLSGGEGFVGFTQAFFLAGARSLLVSLWEVDDRATALLDDPILSRLAGRTPRPGTFPPESRGAPGGQGLVAATLTAEEVDRELSAISRGEIRPAPGKPALGRPFAHPHDWAGFILMGDPY